MGGNDSRTALQRSRILEAAGRCIAKFGFKRATIDEIAAAASLSRPVIYKHFAGKEALIDAVLDAAFDEWLEEIAAADAAEASDSLTRLRGKLKGAIAFALERPILQAILRQDHRVLVADHAESFRRCHERSIEKTREILESGMRSGEVRSDVDLASTADCVEMILFILVERAIGLRRNEPISEAIIESTLTVLLDGLRPRP
ncbi:MAG: TetR/AcrR family transcriptional regulator [Deltaproteobacteria bacterium]|nr:TetR/AcrR family transcriptional regulator [Deltaproteobacteria bacterium]MBW2363352.1 TetR/AcrR family transcriptional regulator [Deltaproteobacteria bacterium]